MTPKVALIGFGEAASTFAKAGQWRAAARAYDIDPERRAAMATAGVASCATTREVLVGASLVLSLVTADQALAVAEAYSPQLAPGTLWCDMNSVAPETKRVAARAVEAAGARYVDVAVLSPVDPARLAAPLLIAGRAAAEAEAALGALGFTNLRVVGNEVGRAAAIKMIRSVMIKGIEGLSVELADAADAAGVRATVMSSLDASWKRDLGWSERVDGALERVGKHGLRRAAEMDEVAATLASLGVDNRMALATAAKQRAVGAIRREEAA